MEALGLSQMTVQMYLESWLENPEAMTSFPAFLYQHLQKLNTFLMVSYQFLTSEQGHKVQVTGP